MHHEPPQITRDLAAPFRLWRASLEKLQFPAVAPTLVPVSGAPPAQQAGAVVLARTAAEFHTLAAAARASDS